VPCGACRQFLAEFNPEMRVIMGGRSDAVEVTTLDALLPDAFVRGYSIRTMETTASEDAAP